MLIYFMAIWNILWIFGISCDHSVHIVLIWYIFSCFGIMHQEKSGNPASEAFEICCSTLSLNLCLFTKIHVLLRFQKMAKILNSNIAILKCMYMRITHVSHSDAWCLRRTHSVCTYECTWVYIHIWTLCTHVHIYIHTYLLVYRISASSAWFLYKCPVLKILMLDSQLSALTFRQMLMNRVTRWVCEKSQKCNPNHFL
jgi:hypothetical protein